MGDGLMEAKEKICRLCLNFEDTNFTKLDASAIGKLKAAISELTERFSEDCLVCSKCKNLIDKAFELKRTFSNNNELIEKEKQKQNCRIVNLTSIVKNATSAENICRICLKCNEGKYVPLTGDEINKVSCYCIPELDKNVTTKPTICSLCNGCLFEMYDFKKECLSVQERIQSCYGSSPPEDIDLNRILVLSRAEEENDFLLGFEVQDEEGTDIFDSIPVSDEDSRKRTNPESIYGDNHLKKPKLEPRVVPKSVNNDTSKISNEELPQFQFDNNLLYNPNEADKTVEEWLTEVEQYKTKYSWSDYTTIHKVLIKLKGINELYIWFSNIADIMDWEQWKKKLIRAFPLKNDYHILVNKMSRRKKLKEETYVSYYTDKLKLMEALDLTDEQKMSCIFGGIPDVLICCVGRVGYKTPGDLLDYFKSCDDKKSVEAAEAKKVVKTPVTAPKPKAKQPIRHVIDNVKNSTVSGSRKQCTDCKRFGHTVVECRKYKIGEHLDKIEQNPIKPGRKAKPRAKRIRRQPKKPQNCSGCGKPGHLQAECPQSVKPGTISPLMSRDRPRAQEVAAKKRPEPSLQPVARRIRCRYCHKHGRGDMLCCPARAAELNGTYIGSYDSLGGDFAKQICLICYQTGHETEECRNSSGHQLDWSSGSRSGGWSSGSQEFSRRYRN